MRFTRKQKNMALHCSKTKLQECYHKSENNLQVASRSGNKKWLNNCMKQHQNFEYALLYKNTPEYKKKVRSK